MAAILWGQAVKQDLICVMKPKGSKDQGGGIMLVSSAEDASV